jgi:hypothetical protein
LPAAETDGLPVAEPTDESLPPAAGVIEEDPAPGDRPTVQIGRWIAVGTVVGGVQNACKSMRTINAFKRRISMYSKVSR